MTSPSEMGTTSHQANLLPNRHLRSCDMSSPRSGNHHLIPKYVLAFFKEVPDYASVNGRVVRGMSWPGAYVSL